MESPSFLKPLEGLPGIKADWIPRVPNVDVHTDRQTALSRLRPHHDNHIAKAFPAIRSQHYAEQIHGNNLQIVSPTHLPRNTHPHCDGLLTNQTGNLLAIYVADCAAIYLADPANRAIALLHSGKKGTEQNILAAAVRQMQAHFRSRPADLTCLISPCIHPPDYEVNFPEAILRQAKTLGITNVHPSEQNTAADLKTFYSYRAEKGKTGRMLALLSLIEP